MAVATSTALITAAVIGAASAEEQRKVQRRERKKSEAHAKELQEKQLEQERLIRQSDYTQESASTVFGVEDDNDAASLGYNEFISPIQSNTAGLSTGGSKTSGLGFS